MTRQERLTKAQTVLATALAEIAKLYGHRLDAEIQIEQPSGGFVINRAKPVLVQIENWTEPVPEKKE